MNQFWWWKASLLECRRTSGPGDALWLGFIHSQHSHSQSRRKGRNQRCSSRTAEDPERLEGPWSGRIEKRERERRKRVYEWMECIDGWPAKRLEVWGYKEGWMKSVNGDREEGEGVSECKKCKKALNIWGDEPAMNGWMVQWMMGFKDGRRKTGVMGDRNDKGSSTVKYLHFPLTVHLKSQTFFC